MPEVKNVVQENMADMIQSIRTPDIFGKVDFIINKSYLPMLRHYPIVEIDEAKLPDSADCACFFSISRIVYDKEENNLQKLASVYASLADISAAISMIIRGYEDGKTEILLGICDQETGRVNGAYPKTKSFQNSLFGNFPGCRIHHDRIMNCEETRIAVNSAFSQSYRSIASASCIGSLRGQNRAEKNNAYYQGIEKVIEAMRGKAYTILILAQPVHSMEIQAIRDELERLYTNLSAFAKLNLAVNSSEATSVSSTLSNTLSESMGKTRSTTLSVGENESHSHNTGTFGNVSIGMEYVNSGFGVSEGDSDSRGWSKSVNEGYSIATTCVKGTADSQGTAQTETQGKTISITIENKKITEALNNITQQLQRIRNGSGTGLFATSAYFLSDSSSEARMLASMYKAVVSGDTTATEYNGINVFCGEDYRLVKRYLKHFRHPVFQLSPSNGDLVAMTTTPATVVTAMELAIQMGLPQHSVNGIPVTESIPFGRDIVRLSPEERPHIDFNLGSVQHLGMTLNTPVNLDLDSLTMHTFITGITGSGKSNTVYKLLNEVQNRRPEVPFLVVEPAKGEYKAAFADREDVFVYGVNPYASPLLRLNPFRFHREIHVLEHIDRLASIFNVCWPMEAAMPAIMKQAIERAYESAGWDLRRSINRYSDQLFPTFSDLMTEVEDILDESQYSSENKGDYIGALCTRLRELTTGLNGLLFTSDDLTDEDLFERNVIIDLSSIGSPETKALVMGLVVVRLQEYRQAGHKTVGSRLCHVTVLEEAHNLLRKASPTDAGGSGLVSKSVEILTNAFAEMRSAGEAFIIADQSPGVLDKSVVRNTNTKIVLRLPEFEDRELVGKAMGLTDAQIVELSKLPTGTAAVYQNDWLEAVLVKVPYFRTADCPYRFDGPPDALFDGEKRDEEALRRAIMLPGAMDALVDGLEGDKIDAIARMKLATRVRCELMRYILNRDETRVERLRRIAFEFFNVRQFMRDSRTDGTLETWCQDMMEHIKPTVADYDPYDQDTLLLLLCSEYARRERDFLPIYLELTRQLA